MNILGYSSFLINTLDTIVSGVKSLGRSCLTWVLGKPSSHVTRPIFFVPQGATARFYPFSEELEAPEVSLFRGMPTVTEAFLEPPSMSGLRHVLGFTLKKALCRTHPFGGSPSK